MAPTSRCDADLVAAARDERDLAAFAELVSRFQHAVFGMAMSVASDRALAEDATQETFLRAWQSLDKLRDPSRIASWLCGIARNVVLAQLRERRREVPDEDAPEQRSDTTPLQHLMEREADRALSELLGRVPKRYRAPLVLHYASERSVSQIAECLGLSEPNVKKLLSRGRELLRDRAQRFTELSSACRVPTTLAVAIVAAAGARSAAAQSATTAGAITTLVTGALVKKKIVIIGALACVLSIVGFQLSRSDGTRRRVDPKAASSTASSIAAAPSRVAASRPLLAGSVLDDRTGRPLPGATVLLTRTGGDLVADVRAQEAPPAVAITDAAGRFTLEVASGRFSVDANLAGYTSIRAEKVAIGDAAHGEVTLRMLPGGVRVRGTVTDVQGGAIVGAVVTAAAGTQLAAPARAAITAADGTYELTLSAGAYDLEAEHPDYAPARGELAIGTAERRHDFQLVPASYVEGTVLDRRDGTPVAGAIVFADGGKAETTTLSDEHGKFRLPHPASTTLALSARADHRATVGPEIVDLNIGETRTDVELWLERGANVAGRVVDGEGRPVAGVSVSAVRWGDQTPYPAQGATDDDGRFVIVGLAPGVYGTAAYATGHTISLQTNNVEVTTRDIDDLSLVVKQGLVVRGRVSPPQPATIRLARSTEGPLAQLALATAATFGDLSELATLVTANVRTRADGSFELTTVAPGSYLVQALGDDGSRGEASLVIERDQRVEISLAATPVVRGAVVDERGAPVAGVVVHAEATNTLPEQASEALTDATGRFELRGFAPGVLELSVVDQRCRRQLVASGARTTSTELTLTSAPADLRLTVTGCEHELRGVIVDASGAPVTDAWIHVTSKGFAAAPIISDASGRFAIAGLEEGPYTITVAHPTAGNAKLEGAATERDHRIALHPADASLRVVVREGGAAVAGFELEIAGATRRKLHAPAAGTIVVDKLRGGAHTLAVVSDRGVGTAEVALEPSTSRTIEVSLRRWATVRGRLVDAAGRPLTGHQVMPLANGRSSNWGASRVTTTDPDGRFELPRVDPQSDFLLVKSPASALQALALQVGAGEQRELGTVTVRFDATVTYEQGRTE